MRIGSRITVGFSISLVAVIAIGLASYKSAQRLDDTTRWLSHTYEVERNLEQILSYLIDAETGARGYALTGMDEYLGPLTLAHEKLREPIAAVRSLTVDNPTAQNRVAQLEDLALKRIAVADDLVETRRKGGMSAAEAHTKEGEGKKAMDAARMVVTDMKIEEERLLNIRKQESAAAVSAANAISLGGMILSLLVVGIGAFLVARSITKPLATLLTGVEEVGRGALDVRVEVPGNDELTDLARAFNRMSESRQKSEAQLAREATERKKTLDALAEGIQTLGGASSELLASTAQQAAGVQEQSAAVAQVVATVNQVSQTSEQSAERARKVADSARRSDEIAVGGRRAVDESVTLLDRAKTQADQVARSILALAEQTQTIGEVLTTINEFADQTNLLSLNAAVEAARAGEQGRGFQVVAGQIKELATQSKAATVQVRRILSEIQKMSNTAVLSTEEGTRGMNAAVKAAQDAGETIRSLAEI
ncbi:MAG TPA: CHASE3 domain-containing protein, partial [Polyangia bacterium]|nr:CHASE3 domain-containing protein [Polyangia bacterium]